MTIDTERAEFEAWVRQRGGDVMWRDGGYVSSMTREWRAAWKAARASSAPAAPVQQWQWINVEERLPEIGVEVMVHPRINDRHMTAEIRRDGLWHYTEEDCYGVIFCETSGVTQWMPLPPPLVQQEGKDPT